MTLFADSVGLGAAAALPRAFPSDWQVNTIGTPAYMVEQLRDRHVVPTLATNRSIIGDHVVIGSGYNYPHWDPARFDRSIDSMIETLTAAERERYDKALAHFRGECEDKFKPPILSHPPTPVPSR